MASIELVESITVPRFLTVSKEAIQHTQFIMGVFRRVSSDPEAYVALVGENELKKKVPHRTNPGVVLGVNRGVNRYLEVLSSDATYTGQTMEGISAYTELVVEEPDGAVIITIDHRFIPTIDLRQDPITDFVLDSFRSHLAA